MLIREITCWGSHVGGWATYYSAINEINLILEALPNISFAATRRTEIEGEMKCIRALLYFYDAHLCMGSGCYCCPV